MPPARLTSTSNNESHAAREEKKPYFLPKAPARFPIDAPFPRRGQISAPALFPEPLEQWRLAPVANLAQASTEASLAPACASRELQAVCRRDTASCRSKFRRK